MEFAPFLNTAIQCNVAIALHSFKEGIYCLEQALGDSNPRKNVRVSSELPDIKVGSAVQHAHPAMAGPGKQDEARPYVYNRSILLDEMFVPNTMATTDTATQSALVAVSSHVCCILLFNYALAYHLQCPQHPEEEFNRNALKLYQRVMRLLESELTSRRHRARCTVLMVLALNNCVEIHYEGCEYVNAEVKRERMIALLSGEHELFHSSSLLSVEDLEGIVTNASMLVCPVAAHAA
jgi:hypothetical protein